MTASGPDPAEDPTGHAYGPDGPGLGMASGFSTSIGMHMEEVSGSRVRGWIDVGPRHLQPGAIVHGGVYAALVEDEALVAMMIQETLAEIGFQVIGPVGTASGALAAARDSHFDAAVLDINLGDGLVYTVAEILEKRGVPFVFVTGYDADSVDVRFSGVPILQKPIERGMLQKIFAPDADPVAVCSAAS